MPLFEDSMNDIDVEDVIKKGGRKPKTLKGETLCLTNFQKFLDSKFNDGRNLESLVLLEDQTVLEECLLQFFNIFRLNNGQRPSKAYFDWFKSFLKCEILKKSQNRWDITNFVQFPRFAEFMTPSLSRFGFGQHPSLPISADVI